VDNVGVGIQANRRLTTNRTIFGTIIMILSM